jgi:hypothetical protein
LSGFDAGWLALRERADTRARAAAATERLFATNAGRRPVRILDLATGTGANPRYLAPRIGGSQDWVLTDADPRLLAVLPEVMESWAASSGYRLSGARGSLALSGPGFRCRFRLQQLDLAIGLERLPLDGVRLVTASALLDLVSAAWLDGLVRACGDVEADLLLALTYDGRVELSPADDGDRRVIRLVNAHQRLDKGFGPALGPSATDVAHALLTAQGFLVSRRASDWAIGAGEPELQAALLHGWADAALEMASEGRDDTQRWLERRLALSGQARCRLRVGHQDLFALAPARSG